MRVEYVLQLLQPKNSSFFRREDMHANTLQNSGVRIKETVKHKEYGSENIVDILTAMQKMSPLGYALFLGKHNKEAPYKKVASILLTQHAAKQRHDKISRASGKNFSLCMRLLSSIVVENICRTADDPGARCRCKGRGCILVKSVKKTCPSCNGTGVKKIPSANAFKIIKTLLHEVSQSSWSRHWKPFYENLISYCEQELLAVESIISGHIDDKIA